MMRIGSRSIDIKPGDSHYVATDEYVVPVDFDIYSIFPHAHSLCREARVDAVLPDGSTKPLIWIKDFDEKWHDNYRFVQPVRVPRGSKLRTSFTYDNSDENFRNRHHPPVRVVYGPNIVDEMQDVYMQVTTVFGDERAAFMEDLDQYDTVARKSSVSTRLWKCIRRTRGARKVWPACYIALGKPKEAVRAARRTAQAGLRSGVSDGVVGTGLHRGRRSSPGGEARARGDRARCGVSAGLVCVWAARSKHVAMLVDAEQAFRRAVELAPAMTDAHVGLADSLAKQKKLAEAVVACEEAIKLSPDAANLYLKLAGFLAREHRYDDCLRNLGRGPATGSLHASAQGVVGGFLSAERRGRAGEKAVE